MKRTVFNILKATVNFVLYYVMLYWAILLASYIINLTVKGVNWVVWKVNSRKIIQDLRNKYGDETVEEALRNQKARKQSMRH